MLVRNKLRETLQRNERSVRASVPAVSDKWKTKAADDAKPRPHKYGQEMLISEPLPRVALNIFV